MTGVSLEIVGTVALVQNTPPFSSSVELTGRASVENEGRSMEILGKAVVREDRRTLEMMGKAAVQNPVSKPRTHMVHFTWTNICALCSLMIFGGVILFARFVYIWQECALTRRSTTWSVVQASIVLGTEVGLLVMAILLCLLVPRMIVTWTTTLVFKYILGVLVTGKIVDRQMVKDGTKVAKEISWITITSVFEEGNAVIAAVLIVCFVTTAILREVLT